MTAPGVAAAAFGFWEAAGGEEPFPRTLDPAAYLALPLTIPVWTARLWVHDVEEWLRRRAIPVRACGPDRLLRGCLIVAVIVVSMTAFTPSSRWLAGSEWAPYFQAVGRGVIWVAPAELRARFYQGLDLLRRVPQTVPGGVLPPPAPAK